MSPFRTLFSLALAATGVAPLTAAQSAFTPPPTFVIEQVRLGLEDDAPRATLVLRDGRVQALLQVGEPGPTGARRLDGSQWIALPAFVDAYTTVGVVTPEPAIDRDRALDSGADVRSDMRLAGRKGLQPSFAAVSVAELSDERLTAYRAAGFGVAVQAPAGQLLAGSSAASTLRPAASRDRVLAPRAFAHGAFRASGSGYPSTTMGYIAQLRQFFLDVAHHGELLARAARGAPGPRPPYDLELEAGLELQGAEAARPLLFEAQSAVDIARVLRCADEFGFRPGIVGGREADRLAEELRTREAPLVLTLDFGEEVEDPRPKGRPEKAADEKPDEKPDETPPPADETPAAPAEPDAASGESADTAPEESADTDRWVYRAPYPVRLERRLRWEERRDCALRLDGAGVPFAFGTGDAAPDALLGRIRGLVERGLPQASALAALTAHPARWLGLSDRLGRIAPGADATLVLWQGNPFVSEEARPVWVFVDGHGHEVPAPELESKDGKERRR